MPEQFSVIELQKTFEDMVGFRANAKISEEGAFASAEKIVDLDEKLVLKTTAPIDLYSAVLATSQLLIWYKQMQHAVSFGDRATLEDKELLARINSDVSQGNLEQKAMKRLISRQYVADPKLGATKAMDILQQLKALYPDAPIRPELEEGVEALPTQ